MSKEVNPNRGYYQPGKNMYYSSSSFSDGSVSRSCTRDDLPDAVNPTFTKDVDMRQLNYATTNCVTDSYDSAWSSNTREATRAPMNTFNPYPTSSSYIGEATNLPGKKQYSYGLSDGIQGPVSTSKVVRSTYAHSFVTYNISNKEPTSQQQIMERDPRSDIVNPMPIKSYNTSKSAPDSNISSEQSLWQNKGINAAIRVIPAAKLKNRPQNPDDPRFVLFPKEPTYNVKIIGGVRIAQQVIKISYRKSLKNTDVYTIGRKGGSCKKALAEGKRKRALWWIQQGKTVEEAILLSLRPYHEIYDEFLEKKHSWGTPMMIRNLLEQINKEGVYNPFIGRPQVNDSETEDDSLDEATEQLIKPQDEYNQSYPSLNNKLGMNLQQNLGIHSNSFMLGTLPSQDNIRNLQTEQETENSSSERASYDPKSHFLKSHTDRNSSLPVNSATFTDLIHTKSDNYSLSSLEKHDKQPVNSKPVSELLYTKRDNPYTKVNTKTKTIGLKDITGAALRRYYYWLKVGKTPEVAKALCVLRMNQIPLYHKIKGTMGTLKKFVKTRQKQVKFSKTLSEAGTGPARMLDKAVSCDINDFTESFCVDNTQGDSESFMPENTEGSADGLGNPNTSKTQVYLNELEQFTKSLKYGSTNYKKIFESVAIDKYRWWRHIGRTIKEAQEMCLQPFSYYPKEREEGVKIIDFKTYILENAVNRFIADGTAKCPTEFKGHKKIRYNFWIKLGKTPKEAIDLTLQDSEPQRRKRQYMERVKKREYLSTLRSSGYTCPSYTQTSQNKNNCDSSSVSIIPTIEEDFTMAMGDYFDAKNNIHTYAKSDDNAKKQVEQAKQLTNTELIHFERWKNQGKSEVEAHNKSIVVSEYLNRIPSNEKEKFISSYTYDGSKSNIPDISQNLRLDEIPNKLIFGENTIKTDTMAETNFPQNIVAQDGHNLPITENLVLPSNVIGSEQGEFKVCIKANKVKMDFVDLEAIKNSLNLCIDDKDVIKIKSFNKRQNIVIITCLNEQTRDWLDKQIPTLVPWENAQLEIIDEDEVPMDILARFFIPFATEAECSSVTPEQFMQQLHEENPDVGCDRWHVLKFETKTVPIGFYVVGCIDNKSRDVLKSKTFKLKWFYQRNIKVSISSKTKKNKAESGARAVLFVPKVPECRLHSSHEYLLNKLHKRNPTVGCDRWTIVQKRIKLGGAALLVRLNNVSKQIVENLKQLRWYRFQKIVITIVPIYVDIELPINNESKHLRNIPKNEIKKALINKLNFFNPLYSCLQWLVVQLQDTIDEWHLTCKINEQCHQMLIKSDYKLYWYGGRWLEIKLSTTVPELEKFGLKNDIKHSKKLATSHQPKDHVPKINLNQIASGSLLSPQLTEVRLTVIPECEKPDRHGQEYLGSVGFEDKEDAPQESYSRGIRRYDEDRVSSSDDRYRLKSNRDAYYPNSEHRNIENVDCNNDDCYQNDYNYENRLEENERRHTSYQNSIVNPDPRSDDEYMNQNIEDYHLDQHLHDSANTREIDNVREERKFDSKERHFDMEERQFDREERQFDREERDFDREERQFDREERDFDRVDRHSNREENNHYREERNFNTEEKYHGREGMNFERGQRYFDREKSHKDGARLDFEHISRQETEYSRRERSPDHHNRSKYAVKMKRSNSRDDQREQNLPHLRPEHREALHNISESLNENKVARDREDRRLDERIHRLNKELADYHERERQYHESSSYSNRDRHNSRPSFDKPPRRRRR